MKSRTQELLDRAIAAMVAAVEIYNKPSFPYRVESFAILAINGWELLLKAKWLADHQNNDRSLFVHERRRNKDGALSKKRYVKKTRSGTPFTYDLSYLADKLVEARSLDASANENLRVMIELRDCATHFYSQAASFHVRVYEVGAGCVRNFVSATREWFGRELSEFSLYLMPLSFIGVPDKVDAVVLNAAEKRFLSYLDEVDNHDTDLIAPYTVSVNVDITFTKSKAKDALPVQSSTDPDATPIVLTEEQIRERYPWDYNRLTAECTSRYSDFKLNQGYHSIRKQLQNDYRFARVRFLDPGNAKSAKKPFFNPNILSEFDKYYTKR